ELQVEAPQCVYDSQAHSASSPGRLRVQSGDGKLSIEGEGFLWRQTNSSLFISNQVHTFVQPALLQQASSETNAQRQQPHQISSASPPTAPLSRFRPQREGGVGGEAQIINNLDIFSDQFSYTADSGLGIYRGHVRASGLRRAEGPPAMQAGTNQLSLTAGLLTIVVPMAERELRNMVAEENVVMDYEGVQATGQRMRYDAETDLAQISGPPQPTWRAGQREGQGDELLIDRTNKIFRATGHARLKMSGQSAGTTGFLAQS